MFEGQYLFDDAAVYGPWFARQGDRIKIVGELIKKNTANIDVSLYTKAPEDSGDGTLVTGGNLTLSTEGTVADKEYSVLKELVRYKFTATGTTAAHYALFRMCPASWFDSI